jgi:serine/threonine-protein kinase ULK/ATG1
MATRAASNAFNRALSLASKKLFGHSSSGHSRASPSRDQSTVPSSPRRPQIITLDREGERDPLEDDLLSSLEEPAQKTDVLTTGRMRCMSTVKAVPQS